MSAPASSINAASLVYTYSVLLGEIIEVTSTSRNTVVGILVGVSSEGLCLKYVRDKEGPYTEHPKPDACVIRFSDFVQAVVRDVSDKSFVGGFGTDSDIAQNRTSLVGRDLQAVGSAWTSEDAFESLEDGDASKQGKWDQFAANAALGVRATYKEELYTSALDKAAFTPAQVRSARFGAAPTRRHLSCDLITAVSLTLLRTSSPGSIA